MTRVRLLSAGRSLYSDVDWSHLAVDQTLMAQAAHADCQSDLRSIAQGFNSQGQIKGRLDMLKQLNGKAGIDVTADIAQGEADSQASVNTGNQILATLAQTCVK